MGSGIFGAIIGLFGTALSRWTDIFERKADIKSQLELEKTKLENTKLELEQDRIRAQSITDQAEITARSNLEQAEKEAEARVMSASYDHDKALAKEDTTKFGSLIRGIVRPLLTLLYSGVFLWVIYYCTTDEILTRNADMIFGAFIEVAVAITLWWFGLTRRGK